jgi:hypothetical protein
MFYGLPVSSPNNRDLLTDFLRGIQRFEKNTNLATNSSTALVLSAPTVLTGGASGVEGTEQVILWKLLVRA